MKRFLAAILSILLITSLLAGCESTEDGDPSIGVVSDVLTEPNDTQVTEAVALVEQILGKDIEAATLNVESVQEVDGKKVVHCVQNYKGVEIVDSSLVAIGGEDARVIGVYYDLSEAFGKGFEADVQEAKRIPDWMKDFTIGDMLVTYDTDSLRPVICLDGETPAVARQFDITLQDKDGAFCYTVVSDLTGEGYYQYYSDYMGFNSTQTQDGIFVAEDAGAHYAYDMEHGVYVTKFSDADESEIDAYYDGSGAKVEKNFIYRLSGDANDQMVLEALDCMANVMQWYEDQFGYRGVDGKGGEALVMVGAPVEKVGSIAANLSETGHAFIMAVTEDGKTAVAAPEIMAHEMGHAVLKNVVGLKPLNEGAALHEAISDVFACLYDPDEDWCVGNGIAGVSSRNISKYNLTMADFRYNYEYQKNEDKSYTYVGDQKIRTYLTQQLSILRGTDKECNRGRYHNASIVSGVMHKVWRDVFNKDSAQFGQVLMDSLQYLPRTATFVQFRAAFMYSARKLGGSKIAERVGTLFDTVGIYHNPDNFAVIQEKEIPNTLIEMMDKNYGDVRAMAWDSCDFTETDTNWYCLCEKDGYRLTFIYEGTDEANPKTLPWGLYLFCYKEQVDPVPVIKGLKFTMTYAEIAEKFDITPLENTEYESDEYPVLARIETEEYTIELYFTGFDENAVFDGVAISPR